MLGRSYLIILLWIFSECLQITSDSSISSMVLISSEPRDLLILNSFKIDNIVSSFIFNSSISVFFFYSEHS